jgi:hypothetical protein
VAAFRAHLKANEDFNRRAGICPADAIRGALSYRSHKAPLHSAEEAFFRTLDYVWNVIVYNYLPLNSRYAANNAISEAYNRYSTNNYTTKHTTTKPTLRLTETQVRMIDAMTEAVGIPHRKRQNEIQIPKKEYYWPYGHNGPGAIDPVTGGPGKE